MNDNLLSSGRLAQCLVVIATALALVTCSGAQPRKEQSVATGILPTQQGDTVQHVFDDPAVAAIWTNAEIARTDKQYDQASELIEEALRIVPDDPVLWSRLAELRYQLGEHVLAENYAAKSNAISVDDRVLQYRNWLIIQHARDQRGDVLGAREAQLEVRKLAPE